VECPQAVIVNEPFVIEPRALARAQKLRDDLKRRGWSEGSDGLSDSPHDTPQPERS
jgi:hypothetical protein